MALELLGALAQNIPVLAKPAESMPLI